MSVDFTKKHQERVDLAKKTIDDFGLGGQKAQVIAVVDISLSMSWSFLSGRMQKLMDRILPLAMQFDDDGSIDVYLFHWLGFHNRKPFTLENRKGYVFWRIMVKHSLNAFFLGFATRYAPIMKRLNKICEKAEKNEPPLFVLYFTDGDCWDRKSSERAIIASSKQPVFWKFVGLGGSSKGFSFLQKLDDLEDRPIDNTDFIHIKNLAQIEDAELYNLLLREFPDWLEQARNHQVI